jgi:hypothetical protein
MRFNRCKIINTENGEISYKSASAVRKVAMLLIADSAQNVQECRGVVRNRELSETDNNQEVDPGKNDRFERRKSRYK